MSKITDKDWWIAAGIRALKTAAQTAIATIGTSAVIEQVDWKLVASASILAGFLSILTSLKGLPEVELKAQIQEGGSENKEEISEEETEESEGEDA